MGSEYAEAQWLGGERLYTLAELVDLSGLAEPDLRELVDCGVVAPANPDSGRWQFSGSCLLTVRTACRLQADFELEPHGMTLVVTLLNRIQELETQLGALRVRVPAGR